MLSELRKKELAQDKRNAARRYPFNAVGEPSYPRENIVGAEPVTAGLNVSGEFRALTYLDREHAARQMALYAAAIGRKRGLLPGDMTGWRLVKRDGCVVTFCDSWDGYSNKPFPKARLVTVELSRTALFDWAANPKEDLLFDIAA